MKKEKTLAQISKEKGCKSTCLNCKEKDDCKEFQRRIDLFLRTRT